MTSRGHVASHDRPRSLFQSPRQTLIAHSLVRNELMSDNHQSKSNKMISERKIMSCTHQAPKGHNLDVLDAAASREVKTILSTAEWHKYFASEASTPTRTRHWYTSHGPDPTRLIGHSHDITIDDFDLDRPAKWWVGVNSCKQSVYLSKEGGITIHVTGLTFVLLVPVTALLHVTVQTTCPNEQIRPTSSAGAKSLAERDVVSPRDHPQIQSKTRH